MDAFSLEACGPDNSSNEKSVSAMKQKKPQVAGIILAAGSSSRMGRPKQLLAFQGKTILDQVVFNALQSELTQVIVVLGHAAPTIQKQVDFSAVHVVVNNDYAVGQSSSLKKGVAAVADCCEGAMFLLGDQPLVGHETINELIHVFRSALSPIVIPFCKGKRGNPVIIHRDLFPQIDSLTGDVGARLLFDRYKESIMAVEVEDTGILFDVDTWKDFKELQLLHSLRRSSCEKIKTGDTP